MPYNIWHGTESCTPYAEAKKLRIDHKIRSEIPVVVWLGGTE